MTTLQAFEVLENLLAAAKVQVDLGHRDDCNTGSMYRGPWQCTCGLDALADAVKEVEKEMSKP